MDAGGGAGTAVDIVRILKSLIKTDSTFDAVIRDALDSRCANSPSRYVNNPFYGNVIIWIANSFEVSKKIFDFLSRIEMDRPDDAVRNIFLYELFFKHTRLGVCAV